MLAVCRAFAVEEGNAARDGLRLSGLDGMAIFLGKAAAIVVELAVLEVVLGLGVVVLYDVEVHGVLLIVAAAIPATIGLAATGTVYGVLGRGSRARETLVPLLVLPAVTPVMLGGTRLSRPRSTARPGDGWPWVQLLVGVRSPRRHARRPGLRAAAGGIVSAEVADRPRRREPRGDGRAGARRSRRPTASQGDAHRLMYLHVPTAWLADLAFFVTAIASALWLVARTRSNTWDLLAGASAEVGVIFTALTLAMGSIWGKPIWGTWWEWDARLTTTAVLFFLYLGYLAFRRTGAAAADQRGQALARSRRSSRSSTYRSCTSR